MCNFFSCIGLKNGDILADPLNVMDHEGLIEKFNLNDSTIKQDWVRLEYTPNKLYNEWILEIDEVKPDWATDQIIEAWKRKARIKAEKHLIRTNVDILDNKKIYILIGDIIIKHAGSVTIEHAGSATIKHAGSGTIEHAGSATIKHAGSATIKHAAS
ncbi:MAG: hypothetical protein GF347_04245, partial [Candidatus Moranbacteria bacterium]|nr:hypothetical protein [Candidatus Moranbacteria bacterium]